MLPLDSRRHRLQQSVEGLVRPEPELDDEAEVLDGEVDAGCKGWAFGLCAALVCSWRSEEVSVVDMCDSGDNGRDASKGW